MNTLQKSQSNILASIKEFINLEIKGWSKLEVLWLVFSSAVLLSLSISWGDNAIGIIAALTGIWCVVLMGMGKRSTFIFGVVNTLCYAYVAFGAKYYGEVMLNAMYFFPMNVAGFFVWKKHMNEETGEVNKRELSNRNKTIIYLLTAVGIVVYGAFLHFLGGNLPYMDSATTIISITAQVLSLYRLTEQWILWIVIDILTIILWAYNFAQGSENISMLIMWSIFLVNAIIMYFKWKKESRTKEEVSSFKNLAALD